MHPLVAALVARVISGQATAAAAAAKPLNILVLYADDWRHDTLGVAGNPVVKIPNLDRLAGEGMRFTQNRGITAIFGVSRACLYTGQWMSRHGCRGFKAWKTPWAETYPGILRSNGYHLGHVGKWHNGKVPAEIFFAAAILVGIGIKSTPVKESTSPNAMKKTLWNSSAPARRISHSASPSLFLPPMPRTASRFSSCRSRIKQASCAPVVGGKRSAPCATRRCR